MSVQHMAMVFAAEGLSGSEKLMLLALTNYTDAHGYCWPGHERLAADTGTSVSTVKRSLAVLARRGLVGAAHRRTETGKSITNMTRVNLAKLESMKRKNIRFEDNLVEQITFADPAATPSADPPDLRTVQSDPPGGPICIPRGVNLNWQGGQDEPQSLTDPPVDPAVTPKAPSARSALDARRASTGSRGRATRGEAASGKSRNRLTRAQYEAIAAVRSLLPDDLNKALPVKTPPNLGLAIIEALAAGAPYERTPAQLVEYRVLRRWSGYWAEKFYAGELTSVVGPVMAMLEFRQECGDISCEDRVNIHTGNPCTGCTARREDRRADRARHQDHENAGNEAALPRQSVPDDGRPRGHCRHCTTKIFVEGLAVTDGLCPECRRDLSAGTFSQVAPNPVNPASG